MFKRSQLSHSNPCVIEICAGAGGQSLGLERAGFDHTLAVELDSAAVETLRENRPRWNVVQGDVADREVWNPADYELTSGGDRIDLFAGGVPCPPFSIAGRQLGAGDERDLFAWAVEQVAVFRPRAVLLENVRGLSMPRFAGYRQYVLDRFREMGYIAEWRLLQASDFGVPQLRPRFVLVALEPDEFAYFRWPESSATSSTVGGTLLPLMSSNGWKGAGDWATSAARIGPTIVGGSKKHGGPDLGPTRAKKAWADLGVDGRGVANSAPGPNDIFEVGPRLTCEMVARIQGWDEEEFAWRFTGKKTSVYRQIGNAFPPPVAKALGQALISALRRKGAPKLIQSTATDIDPLFRALRTATDFLTANQLMKKAGLVLEAPEFDRRMSMLGSDFILEKVDKSTGVAYRLGDFRAFTGQEGHARHEFYKDNVSKVS